MFGLMFLILLVAVTSWGWTDMIMAMKRGEFKEESWEDRLF